MTNKSNEFAEIIGIMLGDGCVYQDKLNKYHSVITLSLLEQTYAEYVKNIFKNYFNYSFIIVKGKTYVQIKNVSIHVGSQFIKEGIIPGNKIKNEIMIPQWIFEKEEYSVANLRGLFDTDGCIYKKYNHYLQIQFKFASEQLIAGTHALCSFLEFKPTKIQVTYFAGRIAYKFYISQQKEIQRFFKVIKPANKKHQNRYRALLSKHNAFKANKTTLLQREGT